MKDHPRSGAFLALTLFFLSSPVINAATLSLDLDIHTPGIQSSRTLNPGDEYAFEVVYTGDGFSQFDTFAFDVVHGTSAIGIHSPVAGPAVDSAPMLALDIYGANGVSSGDPLTQGSIPTPLGYDGGLGGVGVASVGGMPFPLLAEDESVGLFSASLSALYAEGSTLALTGFPFGVGAELSLAGARVPVTLQGATVTVVPIPPALWLFASGVLALLGVGYRKGATTALNKAVPSLSLLFALAMISPPGLAALDSNADLDGDAMVTGQDISKLASCFGQDPTSNSDCARADVDEDGDIDGDDFSFVSARLGQVYPETLFNGRTRPPSFAVGDEPTSIALGDVNGDGVPDVVVANGSSNDISVLLGNGDGSFQAQQRFAVGRWPQSIALSDVNGDGLADVVVANYGSDDISVLLGNGDGSFQAQHHFAVGHRPRSIALGDVNGDGVPDAVVANGVSDDISVLLGNGDGSFQTQQRFSVGDYPFPIALDDVNGDGLPDAVVANGVSDDISVLLGNGDGSFQTQQRFAAGDNPGSIALDDVNGDGMPDVVIANGDSGDISVLLGNGDGSFQAQQRFAAVGGGGIDFPSIALGDLNGDDVPDVVVGGEGDISVLLGNGDGSFQAQRRFAAGDAANSIALGDVNGDGMPDVAVANYTSGGISVLLGNGDGSFQAQRRFAAGVAPNSIALGDVNDDSMPDAVVANGGGDEILVLLSNGDGSFQVPLRFAAGIRPNSIALGDVNGDSMPDAVVANGGGDDIAVLLGNGDGSFQTQQRFAVGDRPKSIVLGDVNGDDMPDVVVANYGRHDISVLLGNGDGSFQAQQRFAVGNWLNSIALGDVNGDSMPDVVVDYGFTSNNYISVLFGNGDGSFQPLHGIAAAIGWSFALDDVNGDDMLDVVVANGSSNDISVLLGNGDGSFQAQQHFAGRDHPGSIALGDVSGDGVPDVVVANSGSFSQTDISVLLGNGDGSFQAPQRFAAYCPRSIALGDMNGDGALDLVEISYSSIFVLLNNRH